jgi:hypothetical protein
MATTIGQGWPRGHSDQIGVVVQPFLSSTKDGHMTTLIFLYFLNNKLAPIPSKLSTYFVKIFLQEVVKSFIKCDFCFERCFVF